MPRDLFLKPVKMLKRFRIHVSQWAWLQPTNEPSRVVAVNVVPRGAQFIAGIELVQNYSPNWQSYLGAAFQNLKAIGTNWAVLTPSWHYTHVDPPVIGLTPGKDPIVVGYDPNGGTG